MIARVIDTLAAGFLFAVAIALGVAIPACTNPGDLAACGNACKPGMLESYSGCDGECRCQAPAREAPKP